jgi:hypothetical protein
MNASVGRYAVRINQKGAGDRRRGRFGTRDASLPGRRLWTQPASRSGRTHNRIRCALEAPLIIFAAAKLKIYL